ncbi:hypothetical protein ACIPPM_04070 [Streptomyces sp. NPDC090119]|uniref:hypothetical protein n=1 Tax=Streptomyces sp. NPDC090119 TaxID=3365951 RepID=UPI003814AD85
MTAEVHDGIGRFPFFHGDSDRLAGSVAVGDVENQAAQAAASQRTGFTTFLIDAYDSAFHQVLLVLAAVCLTLLATAATLLRRSHSSEMN